MSGDQKPPIIVKKIKKSGGGHHGGAWKIAYADFVTAMMAFFLLMWLLGSTAKGDMEGIAAYFKTPLKVALGGGTGAGDSSSVIQGGGTDLTRTNGQVKKGETPEEKRTINLRAALAEIERQDTARLADLKSKIDAAIEANKVLRPYKNQIRVDITPDGLRVQIVDELNRPMFDSGSATLKEYTREILREMGKLMNDVPNRISLSGHTDASAYAMGERAYSNWELSADRANASRRELVIGGIEEKKIIRIVGLGAAVALDKADPYNPINRRIIIAVLNNKAEKRILDEPVFQVPEPGSATPAEGTAPAGAGEAPASTPAAGVEPASHSAAPAGPATQSHAPAPSPAGAASAPAH